MREGYVCGEEVILGSGCMFLGGWELQEWCWELIGIFCLQGNWCEVCGLWARGNGRGGVLLGKGCF